MTRRPQVTLKTALVVLVSIPNPAVKWPNTQLSILGCCMFFLEINTTKLHL
uniref:Uncharacterized protein n=1 Tax=Rhizophora mucronata TaxID=61149 RepID=A0A2P2PS44_RHIMU